MTWQSNLLELGHLVSSIPARKIGQSHIVSRRPFVITPKTKALNNVYEIYLVATSELSLHHHMLPTPPSTYLSAIDVWWHESCNSMLKLSQKRLRLH
jgi:hypothetical protein